jgi:hypothetical protein
MCHPSRSPAQSACPSRLRPYRMSDPSLLRCLDTLRTPAIDFRVLGTAPLSLCRSLEQSAPMASPMSRCIYNIRFCGEEASLVLSDPTVSTRLLFEGQTCRWCLPSECGSSSKLTRSACRRLAAIQGSVDRAGNLSFGADCTQARSSIFRIWPSTASGYIGVKRYELVEF